MTLNVIVLVLVACLRYCGQNKCKSKCQDGVQKVWIWYGDNNIFILYLCRYIIYLFFVVTHSMLMKLFCEQNNILLSNNVNAHNVHYNISLYIKQNGLKGYVLFL